VVSQKAQQAADWNNTGHQKRSAACEEPGKRRQRRGTRKELPLMYLQTEHGPESR